MTDCWVGRDTCCAQEERFPACRRHEQGSGSGGRQAAAGGHADRGQRQGAASRRGPEGRAKYRRRRFGRAVAGELDDPFVPDRRLVKHRDLRESSSGRGRCAGALRKAGKAAWEHCERRRRIMRKNEQNSAHPANSRRPRRVAAGEQPQTHRAVSNGCLLTRTSGNG